MKQALLDIISWAPKSEPPDRVKDEDASDSDKFDAGYRYAMWIAAKRAKEALGK